MNTAPVPDATPEATTYEERREARVTRREEKEQRRKYQALKDLLRSQLRRQLDQILSENAKNFIFLLATDHSLQLSVQVRAPEQPEIEAPPPNNTAAIEALDSITEKKSLARRLIEVVRN